MAVARAAFIGVGLPILSLLVAWMDAAAALAQDARAWRNPPVAYAADFQVVVDGLDPVSGLIAHMPGMTRMTFTEGDGAQIVIFDHRRRLATVVVERQRVAMEIPLANYDTHSPLAARNMIVSVIDQPRLAGEPTTRYRLSWREEGGWRTGMGWVTDDGIAVRVEADRSADGRAYLMVLSNLVRGPQDSSQFSIAPGIEVLRAE